MDKSRLTPSGWPEVDCYAGLGKIKDKGVVRKISRRGEATISVLCMKIQGGMAPPADAHGPTLTRLLTKIALVTTDCTEGRRTKDHASCNCFAPYGPIFYIGLKSVERGINRGLNYSKLIQLNRGICVAEPFI